MQTKLLFLLVVTFASKITFAQSQYFIVFKANSATSVITPGHAFATFVKKDELSSQTIVEHTWGFHPVQKSWKALYSTKGEVELTSIGDLGKSDFVVEVDYITYEYCKELKDRWEPKQYGAIGTNQNCVDFVKQLTALVTPDLVMPNIIYQLPRPYLDKLRSLNSKRDTEGRKALSEVTGTQVNPMYRPNPIVESKPQPVKTTQTDTDLLGGSTPEDLGKILLKAFQTNNLKTWIRCLHPDLSEDEREKVTRMFSRIRDRLTERGLTEWQAVRFSRVTYTNGKADAEKGIKAAYDFVIDFTYKNGEFDGVINLYPAVSLPNKGTYYIWGKTSYDFGFTGLHRNGIFR